VEDTSTIDDGDEEEVTMTSHRPDNNDLTTPPRSRGQLDETAPHTVFVSKTRSDSLLSSRIDGLNQKCESMMNYIMNLEKRLFKSTSNDINNNDINNSLTINTIPIVNNNSSPSQQPISSMSKSLLSPDTIPPSINVIPDVSHDDENQDIEPSDDDDGDFVTIHNEKIEKGKVSYYVEKRDGYIGWYHFSSIKSCKSLIERWNRKKQMNENISSVSIKNENEISTLSRSTSSGGEKLQPLKNNIKNEKYTLSYNNNNNNNYIKDNKLIYKTDDDTKNNNNNPYISKNEQDDKKKSSIEKSSKKEESNSSDDDGNHDEIDPGDRILPSRESGNDKTELVPWLLKREKLYPINKPSYTHLYDDRFSLLDYEWRMSEVYRFGFKIKFNEKLYPSIYLRLYDSLRRKRGVETITHHNIREGSISETKITQLQMSYEFDDMNKRDAFDEEFDLDETDKTLKCLPLLLQSHPPGWDKYKIHHEPPTFTQLANSFIDDEIREKDMKWSKFADEVKARRSREKYGDPPPLENSMKNSSPLSTYPSPIPTTKNIYRSSSNYPSSTTSSNYCSSSSLMDSIFGNFIDELSTDLIAEIESELDRRSLGDENKFADKKLLKKPPVPPEIFTGKDMAQAATILNFILVNIARYDFSLSESFILIESSFSQDAKIWFDSHRKEIFSKKDRSLHHFITLFKQKYMSPDMAIMYENQLKNTKLLNEKPHSVDVHYNQFIKIATMLRSCDHATSEQKLIHYYFQSLPESTQRTLGIAALNEETVAKVYQMVKKSAIMIGNNTSRRILDREVVSVNTMHAYDDDYYHHNYDENNDDHDDGDLTHQIDNDDNNDNNFDEYGYIYPDIDDNDYIVNHNAIDSIIMFNANSVSKFYQRDLVCFHCGDKGHRAGWFCPIVRMNKPQTPRGVLAYAQFIKKYEREAKTYDINDFLLREKQYWESKGKNIKSLVEDSIRSRIPTSQGGRTKVGNHMPRSTVSSRSSAGTADARPSPSSFRPASRPPPFSSSSFRGRLPQKSGRQAVDLVAGDDGGKSSDVEEVTNNNTYIHNDTYNNTIYDDQTIPSYTIHLNGLHDDDDHAATDEELILIRKLANIEQKYAHPLAVRTMISGKYQNALLDHGATRNLCRKSIINRYYPDLVHEKLPSDACLISSCGTTMPIETRVRLSVAIAKNIYRDALFYVVTDTPSRDMISSFVLGRTFLSTAKLCYDYEKDILFNKHNIHQQYITIYNGRFITQGQGERKRSEIVPISPIVTTSSDFSLSPTSVSNVDISSIHHHNISTHHTNNSKIDNDENKIHFDDNTITSNNCYKYNNVKNNDNEIIKNNDDKTCLYSMSDNSNSSVEWNNTESDHICALQTSKINNNTYEKHYNHENNSDNFSSNFNNHFYDNADLNIKPIYDINNHHDVKYDNMKNYNHIDNIHNFNYASKINNNNNNINSNIDFYNYVQHDEHSGDSINSNNNQKLDEKAYTSHVNHHYNIKNTNNKIKNKMHRNNMVQRKNNIKNKYDQKLSKINNIMSAIETHLAGEYGKVYTHEMKNILLNYIETHIDDYDTISLNDDSSFHSIFFNNNTVVDEDNMKIERRAQIEAYKNAYSKSNDKNVESDVLVGQMLKLIHDNYDNDENEDQIMKNINDINELSPPTKIPDNDEIRKMKEEKLTEMIGSKTHLTESEREKLKNLITQYFDVYSLNGENFKQTDVVQHEIHLMPNSKPFHQRLRVYSPALQDIINVEVNKMIKDKIIVRSSSPFASNLLLVRKPDPSSPGGMKNRVCVNFIQLNKITVKDRYPLPNQEDIFRQIGSAEFFTTMDLMSGFWQLAIKPEHRHLTAFITSRGLYEFLVMPFGLCNAPSTFQRMMDKIIRPEWRAFIQTYIDDIITYSKSFSSHLDHLKILHETLRKNNLTVKLSKCHFAEKSVKFLGHIISAEGIKPNPEKIDAIKAWKQPTDVSAVRSFLGAVGWYRKFIPHFAEIAVPLFHLTKKNTPFKFDETCQKSFNILRDALMKEPVLRQADLSKDYYFTSDASDVALGAVLQQKDDDGILHPIAYASKTLNDAQRNYSTTEKECLALIWGLEHFNTYCEGHNYTCLTDHRALTHLVSNKESNNNRITRWILRLQPYNLKIEYIKGSENHTADLLSRPYLMQNSLNVEIDDDEKYAYINGVTTRSKNDNKTSSTSKMKIKRSTRAEKQIAEYDVEEILDRKKLHPSSSEYLYHVKWKGYDDTYNTWEPISNLKNSTNMIVDFERNLQKQKDMKNNNNNNKNNDDENYTCEICNLDHDSYHQFLVHQHNEHQIPLPKLDSEIGMIDEIDDSLLEKEQQNDKTLSYIYDSALGSDTDKVKNMYERKSLIDYDFYKNDKGVLYCTDTSPNLKTRLRVVVPKILRRKLISEVHDGIMSPHHGIAHTCRRIQDVAWWPHWRSDVIKYVMECDRCQRVKNKKMMNQIPRPVTVPSRPFQHIGIDVVGPLPTTSRGNVYILTVVDHFTRWAEAIPLVDQTTKSIAQAVIKNIICRHGLFDTMTSDNGSVFVSELASYIYKELGIRRVKTTPFNPNSNGIPERLNGTMKSMLKIWCNEEQDNWDEYLPYVMFAYNTSFHSLIQETPYFLVHGRDPKLLSDIIINREMDVYMDQYHYGEELISKLKSVYEKVKNIYNNINNDRMKALQDVEEKGYEIGDKVLLYDPTTQVGKSRKLTVRWKGPFLVVQKRNDVNYIININGKMSLVNKRRLRGYKCESITDESYINKEKELMEEIARISELELQLREQKLNKERQLEIAKANKELGVENSVEVVDDNKNINSVSENDDENLDLKINSYMIIMNF